MVESLIENVHREDLNIKEKGKYMKKIMELENIPSALELSKRIKVSPADVVYSLDAIQFKGPINYSQVSETKILEKKDRERVIKKAQEKGIGGRTLRELSGVVKKAPEEVKEALLDEKTPKN